MHELRIDLITFGQGENGYPLFKMDPVDAPVNCREEEEKMAILQFTIESDGLHIFVRKFIPNELNSPKGVVLLSHGRNEHSARYFRFCNALMKNGYIAYIHDQRGHGNTAENLDAIHLRKGDFDGMVDDIQRLYETASADYPDLPVFLFGHSLGSMIASKYIQKYGGANLKGVILSGPAQITEKTVSDIDSVLMRLLELHDDHYVDAEVSDMLNRSLTERFLHNGETGAAWLSRDEYEIRKKFEDPLFVGPETIGWLYEFLVKGTIWDIFDEAKIANINKKLSVLVICGDHDPSTNNGKSAKLIETLYKKAGISDVSVILYPDGRHELLNDINREQVTQDLINWMGNHLMV
jgi:alpha-beta hydrolase superfamily lysophospholipase